MKIIITDHFKERAKERLKHHDLDWIERSFKQWIKMHKRHKKGVFIKKASHSNSDGEVYILIWKELKYYFSKKNWDWILISFWIRIIQKEKEFIF